MLGSCILMGLYFLRQSFEVAQAQEVLGLEGCRVVKCKKHYRE
ncbi:MAG: hypothetical protein [Malazfec virus 1]